VSDSYTAYEHEATRFAIEDAERDLLNLVMHSASALATVTTNAGITPSMVSDDRHRALLGLLVDLHARDEFTGDFAEIASRVAELRKHPVTSGLLADAGELDGELLYDLWSYQPPDRHTAELACEFLLSAHRERIRDETIEACIAALSLGGDTSEVLAHLRAAIEPTSTPGPDAVSAVLSVPTTKEH
jgi:hypothetical protein